MVKLSALKLNTANPRVIKDEKFKKLVQSVKEFPKMMALRPIIIDDDGTILGGNMRYRALLSLGYKEIPDEWVRKASELTDEEKQRFIIEDNVQFGDWDMDKLANEWEVDLLNEWGLNIKHMYNIMQETEEIFNFEAGEKVVIEIRIDEYFFNNVHKVVRNYLDRINKDLKVTIDDDAINFLAYSLAVYMYMNKSNGVGKKKSIRYAIYIPISIEKLKDTIEKAKESNMSLIDYVTEKI